MKNFRMINTLLLECLEYNLMSSSEIIIFIDNLINCLSIFPYEYIEISLIGDKDKNKLISLLKELDNIEFDETVANLLLSYVCHKYVNNEIRFSEALKIAGSLVEKNQLYLKDKYYSLFYFDDSYELALSNVYGDFEQIERDFRRELGYFEQYYECFKKVLDVKNT